MLLIVLVGHVGLRSSTTHAVATPTSAANVSEVHFIFDAGMRGKRAILRGIDSVHNGVACAVDFENGETEGREKRLAVYKKSLRHVEIF